MKKVVISLMCIFTLFAFTAVYAQNDIGTQSDNTKANASETTKTNNDSGAGHLVEMKEKSKKKLEDYKQEYGSDTYGLAAYLLNIVRVYSIPCCFIGIAVGAIYQYVIGIRKLDERDRGFNMIIGFVTILVIAQILPLIFAIVVKGWRG